MISQESTNSKSAILSVSIFPGCISRFESAKLFLSAAIKDDMELRHPILKMKEGFTDMFLMSSFIDLSDIFHLHISTDNDLVTFIYSIFRIYT